MNFIDVLLTGVALAMDAATVSISNGLANPKMKIRKMLLIAIVFGLFQGIMPLLGYLAGSIFADFITSIAPWVALILLCTIGIKTIYETLKKSNDEEENKELSFKELIVQGIATSIDAFAVGITFLCLKQCGEMTMSIYLAVGIIAIVTFIISFTAIIVGGKIGKVFKNKAELIGGIILIVLGIKIFVEGVFC